MERGREKLEKQERECVRRWRCRLAGGTSLRSQQLRVSCPFLQFPVPRQTCVCFAVSVCVSLSHSVPLRYIATISSGIYFLSSTTSHTSSFFSPSSHTRHNISSVVCEKREKTRRRRDTCHTTNLTIVIQKNRDDRLCVCIRVHTCFTHPPRSSLKRERSNQLQQEKDIKNLTNSRTSSLCPLIITDRFIL